MQVKYRLTFANSPSANHPIWSALSEHIGNDGFLHLDADIQVLSIRAKLDRIGVTDCRLERVI